VKERRQTIVEIFDKGTPIDAAARRAVRKAIGKPAHKPRSKPAPARRRKST
jgi:hypothetical protein